MRLYRVLVPALVIAGLALSASPAHAVTYAATAWSEANTLRTSLDSIGWPTEETYNFYPGKNGNPNIASTLVWGATPTTSAAKSQCAPMVTLALRHSYSWADDAYFTTNFSSSSPTSAMYHDELMADTLPHFDKKTKLTDLLLGDVIAIKYSASNSGNGDPTGHMAFFVSKTAVDKDNNPATLEYAVTVLDSTSNPHGVASSSPSSPYQNFRDSRAVGATEYDGLGQGSMVFRVDAVGNVLGYWWGINENVTTEWHPVSDRPVVFGRITSTV